MASHDGPSAGCGGRLRRSLGVEGAQAVPAAAITDTAGLEEAPGPALDFVTRVLGRYVLENERSELSLQGNQLTLPICCW